MLGNRADKAGFTLIELMIVVAIIGVLASVAIPTFEKFVKESKGSEAYSNVGLMARGATAYYYRDFAEQGLSSSSYAQCTILEAIELNAFGLVPDFPITPEKKTADFAAVPTFAALGFTPSDPLYYHYAMDNIANNGGADGMDDYCNVTDGELYVMYALGDLDGDGKVGVVSIGLIAEKGQVRKTPGFGNLMAPTGIDMAAACPFCVNDID
ncbi:MAG: prepilin-type N-terminal cleavage/methylation domain-containing protein [Myxococcales bacterium]|nr:prepilin-type N-terminal cleavage/methylation domain-containing protein [Myxococcales bacterium]